MSLVIINLDKNDFLKLLQEMRISLAEPIVEDSIDGCQRIRVTYTTAISRKGVEFAESVIRFQYERNPILIITKSLLGLEITIRLLLPLLLMILFLTIIIILLGKTQ